MNSQSNDLGHGRSTSGTYLPSTSNAVGSAPLHQQSGLPAAYPIDQSPIPHLQQSLHQHPYQQQQPQQQNSSYSTYQASLASQQLQQPSYGQQQQQQYHPQQQPQPSASNAFLPPSLVPQNSAHSTSPFQYAATQHHAASGHTAKRRRSLSDPSRPSVKREPDGATAMLEVPARASDSSSSTTPIPSGPRTTQRQPKSCQECSRRKIKCDKTTPCKPCINRGEGALCRREVVIVKGKMTAPVSPLGMPAQSPPASNSFGVQTSATVESLADDMTSIQVRVTRLEKLLANSPSNTGVPSISRTLENESPMSSGTSASNLLSPNVATDRRLYGSSSQHSTNAAADPSRSASAASTGAKEASTETNASKEGMEAELQRILLGRQENAIVKGPKLPPSQQNSPTGNFGGVASSPRQRPHSQLLNSNPTMSSLPGRTRCQALTRAWFEEFSFLNCVVHFPTFLGDERQFWDSKDAPSDFLALYFAILATAGFFLSDNHLRLQGFNPADVAQSLAPTWFENFLSCLYKAEFLSSPSIYSIQAIFVSQHAFHFSGNSGIHLSFFSIAITACRTLGLHLLGSEDEKIFNTLQSSDDSIKERKALVQREVGRRLWTHAWELDWQFIPILGWHTIPSHSFTSSPPLNIQDADFMRFPLPHPDGQHTNVSYLLAHSQSMAVLYRLLGSLRSDQVPAYSDVVACSEELQRIKESLPDPLQTDYDSRRTNGAFGDQRHMLACELAHVTFTVHKTWFSKSFKDPTYDYSYRCCLEAADIIVSHVQMGFVHEKLRNSWPILMACTNAGLIICLDLLNANSGSVLPHIKSPSAGRIQSQRAKATWLMNFLKNAVDPTELANRGFLIIKSLLQASETLPGSEVTIPQLMNIVATMNADEGKVSDVGGRRRLPSMTPSAPPPQNLPGVHHQQQQHQQYPSQQQPTPQQQQPPSQQPQPQQQMYDNDDFSWDSGRFSASWADSASFPFFPPSEQDALGALSMFLFSNGENLNGPFTPGEQF